MTNEQIKAISDASHKYCDVSGTGDLVVVNRDGSYTVVPSREQANPDRLFLICLPCTVEHVGKVVAHYEAGGAHPKNYAEQKAMGF